jgi:predicted O-methyltransferase YrrM
MLDRALSTEGWTTPAELALLSHLGAEMPPGAVVVEVGSHRGRSTLAIADGLSRVSGARLVAVDPFTGDPGWNVPTPAPLEARSIFESNTAGIAFLEVIQTTSVEASQRFPDASLDWVFIDGIHDYRNVRDDIRAWAPKVKPGGLIAGHDYGSRAYAVTDVVLALFGDVAVEASIWMTRESPRLRARFWIRAQVQRPLRRARAMGAAQRASRRRYCARTST